MAGKQGIVHRRIWPKQPPSFAKVWLRYPLVVIELALMATDLAESQDQGCPLPSFWLALMLSILITIFDVFLLLGLMHLGFPRSGPSFQPRSLQFWLSGFLSSQISENLRCFTPSKRGAGWTKRNDLNLGAWMWCNRNASITLSPLPFRKHEKSSYKDPADIKRAVRFMTWDSNIELKFGFRRQLPPLDSWSSPLLWSRR